jgi:hypothetical protein
MSVSVLSSVAGVVLLGSTLVLTSGRFGVGTGGEGTTCVSAKAVNKPKDAVNKIDTTIIKRFIIIRPPGEY